MQVCVLCELKRKKRMDLKHTVHSKKKLIMYSTHVLEHCAIRQTENKNKIQILFAFIQLSY